MVSSRLGHVSLSAVLAGFAAVDICTAEQPIRKCGAESHSGGKNSSRRFGSLSAGFERLREANRFPNHFNAVKTLPYLLSLPMKPLLFLVSLGLWASTPGTGWTQEWKGERILFVGNSITLHEPAPKIGWNGNWGMAASVAKKDYVHLVVTGVEKLVGIRPEFLPVNIADFERAHTGVDVNKRMKEAFAFHPDTVVMAIGENVPVLGTEAAKARFKTALLQLFTALRQNGRAVLIVRSCFWPNTTKDRLLQEACAEVGGTFVDISGLVKAERNFARSERKIPHAGVGHHPGDGGMKVIADAVLASMKPLRTESPVR